MLNPCVTITMLQKRMMQTLNTAICSSTLVPVELEEIDIDNAKKDKL